MLMGLAFREVPDSLHEPVEFLSAVRAFVVPFLYIAHTELLQCLQNIVEKSGLRRFPGRHLRSSYTAEWTL